MTDYPGRAARPLTNTERLVSASTGALLTAFFVTPLDVVKTRLQVQSPTPVNCVRTPSEMAACPQCNTYFFNNGLMDIKVPKTSTSSVTRRVASSPFCSQQQFSSGFDAFVKIVRFEGPARLWSGVLPSLYMAVPATVLYFNAYDILKERFQFVPGADVYSAAAFAGVTARVFASTVVSPLELLRTRFQAQQGAKNRSVLRTMSLMVRNQGVLSLCRGLMPTLARDVPFSAIYWSLYEVFKQRLVTDMQVQSTFLSAFLSGASSGSVAAICTNPFDVVKTRRQALLSISGMSNAADFPHVTREPSEPSAKPSAATVSSAARSSAQQSFSASVASVSAAPKGLCERTVSGPSSSSSRSPALGAAPHPSLNSSGSNSTVASASAVSSPTQSPTATTTSINSPKKHTTYSLMRQIIQEEGASALMTGAIPRVMRISLACAIMISSYETGKAFFASRHPDLDE